MSPSEQQYAQKWRCVYWDTMTHKLISYGVQIVVFLAFWTGECCRAVGVGRARGAWERHDRSGS